MAWPDDDGGDLTKRLQAAFARSAPPCAYCNDSGVVWRASCSGLRLMPCPACTKGGANG